MGTNNKYRISEDGIIYSLNDDGSISQLGKIVDDKVSAISDRSDEDYQFDYNCDGLKYSRCDEISNEKYESTNNPDSSGESTDHKGEFIRLETQLNQLKSRSINIEYFDKVLLSLIDGFIWGKTSYKDIPASIYRESTYYYYLDISKKTYLYQNKNYKVFHTLSIDDISLLPIKLKTLLYFEESYSFKQWLKYIDLIGLKIGFNSRKRIEGPSIFGDLFSEMGMLTFESNLFSITLNLYPIEDNDLNVVKSMRITYKLSPERSFLGKLFK